MTARAPNVCPEAQPAQPPLPLPESPLIHINELLFHGQHPHTNRSETDQVPARLPRIPRPTADCPHPLTLEQLNHWKDMWAAKNRPSTSSERDDYSECDRQFLDPFYASSTESEDSDSEEQRVQARIKSARQRPLSPPSTPPHLKGPKLYKDGQSVLAPQNSGSKVEKVKPKGRAALHRPYTRSRPTPPVSLHDRKGQVKFWHLPNWYVVISYEQYLRDYDGEDLDSQPVEPMDFSHENPRYPRKTPYQREVCRRGRAHMRAEKTAVHLPYPYKGNR